MPTLEDLKRELEENKSVEVSEVNKEFGYLEFDKFPTNFNGPMKRALGLGMIISAVNHKRDNLRLYFSEIDIGTVEETVTVEKEIATLTKPDDEAIRGEPNTVEIDR